MTTATSIEDKTLSAADSTSAAAIPYVTPAEAERLASVELHRLLDLLSSLGEEDWHNPTACTRWDVHAMVAHQAGAYASGATYGELIHQYTAAIDIRRPAEDAINERQLADRAQKTAAELIEELRATGDRAVRNWAYGFRPVKLLGIPHPVPGWLSVRHLMLVVHSRDTWIHRLDICRATNRPFEQTREHDGRINALVVKDLARKLAPRLGGRAIALETTGIAGGSWRIGESQPAATIVMDTLDFNIYASGRMKREAAAARTAFSGDVELAERAFQAFEVLY